MERRPLAIHRSRGLGDPQAALERKGRQQNKLGCEREIIEIENVNKRPILIKRSNISILLINYLRAEN